LVSTAHGKKEFDCEKPVIAKISQETLTEVIGTPGSRVLFS
jgi:hypothetical protein